MGTYEIDDDKVRALKEALRVFNRFFVNHSDNCAHRYCDESPCSSDEDCQAGDDRDPCDPDECFAAASENLGDAADAVLSAIEAVR